MMKSWKYNSRGEIATILTIVSTILLVAGVAAGSFVAQRTTDTRSRAEEPNCSAEDIGKKTYLGIAEDRGIAGAVGCDCDEVNNLYVRWHRNCDCKPGGDCPNVYPEVDNSCEQILESNNYSCSFRPSSASPTEPPSTTSSCPSPYSCLENPICTAINGTVMPFSCSGTTAQVCCRLPDTPTITTAPPAGGGGGATQNNSISGNIRAIFLRDSGVDSMKLYLYYGNTDSLPSSTDRGSRLRENFIGKGRFEAKTITIDKESLSQNYNLTSLDSSIKYAVVAIPGDSQLINAVQVSCNSSRYSPGNYCTDLDLGDTASFQIDFSDDDYNSGYNKKDEAPTLTCRDNNSDQQTCPIMYPDNNCVGNSCMVHRACSPDDPPDNWCQYTCIDTRTNLQVPCWKGQKTDLEWLFPPIGKKCNQNDVPMGCPYTYDDCGGTGSPCILYRACASIRQLFSFKCRNTCIDKNTQERIPCPERPFLYLSPTPTPITSSDSSPGTAGITGSTNVAIQKAMDRYAQGTLTATQRSAFINQLCRVSGIQFKSCDIAPDGSSLDCSSGC